MPVHAQLTPRQVRDLLSRPEGDLDPQINEDITYLELRPLLHRRQGFRERDEVYVGRDQWSPASSRMWSFLHGHYVAPNHRLDRDGRRSVRVQAGISPRSSMGGTWTDGTSTGGLMNDPHDPRHSMLNANGLAWMRILYGY